MSGRQYLSEAREREEVKERTISDCSAESPLLDPIFRPAACDPSGTLSEHGH